MWCYRTIAFLALAVVLTSGGCRSVQVTESAKGAVITVRANEDSIPRVGALVCRPKTVSRPGAYDIRIHVKRVEGNCAFTTFRCGEAAVEGPEVKVCIGDPPVNTGCNTMAGNPISLRVTAIFD